MLFAKTRNKIKNEKVKMPSICIFFNITLTKSRNSSGLTLLSQMTDYFPGTIAKIHSEYNVIMEKYRVEYHDRIAAEFKESTCNPDVTDLSIRGYRDNRCRITNSSPALAILVLFADELIKNGFAKLNCQEMLIVHTATADCAPIALNALIRLVLKNRAVDGIKFEEDIFRKRATAYRDACSALYRNTMTNANANANTIEDGLFTYFYCALCAAILRTRLDGFTENLMHPLLDVEYPEDTVTKIHREYDIIMESYRVAYHDRIATEFKECMYDSNVTNLSVSGYCQNGCKIAHNSPVLAIITLLADKLFDHGFNDVSECRDMLIVYTVMANCAPIALEQTMREILKSGKISKKEINYRADS